VKLSFRQMWSEFKAFAFKGNLIDLAVAVVLGAAFSGVINSLVKDIIMPTVSYGVTAAREAKQVASNVASKAGSAAGISGASQPATTQSTTAPVAAAPAPAPPSAPKPADDRPLDLDWKIGRLQVGHFVAELLNFIIVAFAIFLIIVKLLGSVMKRVGGTPKPEEPTTKECPKCLSMIPLKAVKCAHCTADIGPAS
jgi:large conductance mechanosensitive channel